MKIELTEFELELIERGLSDHISEFCVGETEEKPYRDLLDKLKEIKEENFKC